MASGPGRTPRAAAKPGGHRRRSGERGRSRGAEGSSTGGGDRSHATRGGVRASASSPSSPAETDRPLGSSDVAAALRRRTGLTTRALALGVVLLLLAISYASSLRVFFDQQRQLAEVNVEIADREQRIAELNGELARWEDPEYVRTQARERLGWAMPGETSYVVVGPDGKPLGPGAEIAAAPEAADQRTWWQRLGGSVTAADQPRPTGEAGESAPPTPQAPRTVAPSPTPSGTPTGR